MSTDRLERLKSHVEKQPGNPMATYALAMEYRKLGRREEAVATFEALAKRDPAYVPTYLQMGYTLAELQRPAQAREVLLAGITVAMSAGDEHAASELQRALTELPA